MSSRFPQQNYMVPPPNHPSHTGGNNSNGQQKLHQNVAAANAAQQQQIALEQQKNKLVNTEYTTIGMNHQPAPLQHNAAMSQNYRLAHPANNNYHVTTGSSSYSQSGPVPQQQQQQIPTGGPGSLRKTITSTPNTPSQQQDKMQQQQSQQQPQLPHHLHMQHPRQQQSQQSYNRNQSNAPTSRSGISNTGSQQMNSRQAPHVPPSGVVMYAANPQMYPYAYRTNIGSYSQPGLQGFYPYYNLQQGPSNLILTHPPRTNGNTPHLQTAQLTSTMSGNVAGASSTQLSHQPATHQQHVAGIPQLGTQGSHHQISAPLYSMQRSTPDNKKRQRNPIPIIDPTSGEAITVNNKSTTSSHSSSSNTHSAALKIEAPMSPPIVVPPASNNVTAIEGEPSDIPHVQGDFEPMLNVTDSTYPCEAEVTNVDDEPHTPVVSANADGPSVDITPKPSKNIKRNNKSDSHSAALTIEKPADFVPANQRKGQAPSTETRTNAECDKSSKLTPTSSEWVKNVQTSTRSSIEKENTAQTTHKMKDRSTVTTTASPPTSTANVPSSPARIQKHGGHTPATIQTAKPTPTQVSVTAPVELIDTSATVESSNVESTTKAETVTPATILPTAATVVAGAAGVVAVAPVVTDETVEEPIIENNKLDSSSSSSSSTPSNATTSSTDHTDRVASIDENVLDSNCNLETNNNNNSINVKDEVSAPIVTEAVSTESPDNTKETTSNIASATSVAETIETDAETINNIKNNNLSTTTTSTTTSSIENNNVVIDQDVDNTSVAATPVALVEQQTPAGSATATESIAAALGIARDAADKPENVQDATADTEGAEEDPTGAKATAKSQTLLNYEEGQWSPNNADGKKCYNREQLYTLRDAPASLSSPCIQDRFQLIAKKNAIAANYCMPNFATGNKNPMSQPSNRNQYSKRPSQGQQQQMQQGGKGSRSGMIHVSLSLREDVKLNESANAWKPTFLTGAPPQEVEGLVGNNIEILCKKVRGILNKLTPEKFDPLLEQLQALNINNGEKLSSVISLVFEKAIDEPNFSSAYAALCKKLSKPIQEENDRKRREESSSGQKSAASSTADFKKELVNKCQKEFDNHVANENSMRLKLTPLENEINETTDPNRKMELRGQLEEEERKLRRRSVGTVRFIGELYRQDMLVTNIMDWCITALIQIRTEEKLECLCKLLTTVGSKMETKTADDAWNAKYYRDLSHHFKDMQAIASDKKNAKINSRVRFMLLDVIDLRRNKWVPRRNEANPKTMDQIQKDIEQEQYNNKMMMMSMNNSGGGGGGSGMGNNNARKDNRDRNDRGGNARNDSRNMNNNNNNKGSMRGYQDNDGWIQQGSSKGRNNSTNPTFDPSKFIAKSNIDDQTTLGSSTIFKWNHSKTSTAPTPMANSYSLLESDKSGGLSGYRSKEPYKSKGSMEHERDRDGPGSRSGSQHGSRDNSTARSSYSSSRSLQQMRPQNQMQYNTLPMSSSIQKSGMRGDSKLNQNHSLSSSTTSLTSSSYNMPSMTSASSDSKLSADVSDDMLKKIKSLVKKALTSCQYQYEEFNSHKEIESVPQIDDIPECNRWAVVLELHNMGVDLTGLNSSNRNFVGTLCSYWIKRERLTKQDYVRGLTEYLDFLEDVVIDVPKVYEYTASMIASAIKDEVISLSDLKDIASGLIKNDGGDKLIGALLLHIAYEYGPCYARDLWKRSNLQWQHFVKDENRVHELVKRYKLQFIENPKEPLPPVATPTSAEKLRARLRELVHKPDPSNEIAEFIKVNVPVINKSSVRSLVKTLVDVSLDGQHQLQEPIALKWIEVVKNFIGSEDQVDLQVECLNAVQLLSTALEHPSGLLKPAFHLFYEYDFVHQAAFQTWKSSPDFQEGKGVAIKNLTSFFNMLNEDENDDED